MTCINSEDHIKQIINDNTFVIAGEKIYKGAKSVDELEQKIRTQGEEIARGRNERDKLFMKIMTLVGTTIKDSYFKTPYNSFDIDECVALGNRVDDVAASKPSELTLQERWH